MGMGSWGAFCGVRVPAMSPILNQSLVLRLEEILDGQSGSEGASSARPMR